MSNMSFADAFLLGPARVQAAYDRGDPLKVFDWVKAAQLIAQYQPKRAEAGLLTDWDYTGGEIWRDGKPVTDDYTHLASMWAIPAIRFDDGTELQCYTTDETLDWDANTKWPQEALDVLAR